MNAPADRFKFSASALATLVVAVLAAVALSIASPWGVIVIMLLAAAALLGVWFKAGIRSGRWLWLDPRAALTQAEGAVWLSALVIVIPAFSLMALGSVVANLPDSSLKIVSFGRAPSMPDERAVNYSDPDDQLRFKRKLEAASIPHRVYERDGQEFIGWSRQNDEAVQKIQRQIERGPIPSGRNVSFDNAEQQQRFIDWLTKQGISHEVIERHGRSIVVWAETSGDVLERFAQHQGADCRRQEADKAKKGTKRQGC